MALFNIIKDIHTQTKRDYLGRVIDFDKAECALIAKKFGFDYWDGDRRFGYGGYKYDGRWLALAKMLIEHFNLKNGDKILDVGCGKGYLLYEFKQLLPDLIVVGADISQYAISNGKPEIYENLIVADGCELPFKDNEFDAVVSLGTLHNLTFEKLVQAIKEIKRVSNSDRNYIMVESWRNEREKVNMICWSLTCESFFPVATWEWIFHEHGYLGDWDFIFFE